MTWHTYDNSLTVGVGVGPTGSKVGLSKLGCEDGWLVLPDLELGCFPALDELGCEDGWLVLPDLELGCFPALDEGKSALKETGDSGRTFKVSFEPTDSTALLGSTLDFSTVLPRKWKT